jgi:hypothetical protein
MTDIRENAFSFFHFLQCWLLVVVQCLFCWRIILLLLVSSENYFSVMKGYWILLTAFTESIDMIMWYFSLIHVLYYGYLLKLTHPCIPGMKPTWSWYKIFLMCWIQFARILVTIFVSMFINEINVFFLFCCYPYLVSG